MRLCGANYSMYFNGCSVFFFFGVVHVAGNAKCGARSQNEDHGCLLAVVATLEFQPEAWGVTVKESSRRKLSRWEPVEQSGPEARFHLLKYTPKG